MQEEDEEFGHVYEAGDWGKGGKGKRGGGKGKKGGGKGKKGCGKRDQRSRSPADAAAAAIYEAVMIHHLCKPT